MPRRKLTEEEKAERKAKMEYKQRLDHYKGILSNSLKECHILMTRKEIRKPTFFFQKGERVRWGNWDWVYVLESYEDGMYYKVFKINSEEAYGRYVGERFQLEYVMWWEIRPYDSMDNNRPRILEDDDIRFNYGQRDIYSLLHCFYSDHMAIQMDPDYQRELVWTEKQKVGLINSIFRNIDIGKFTFIKLPYSSNMYHLEVLDGKQRTQAIVDFYECRFKYRGMTFNELHWRDRVHFKNYAVNWAETEPLTQEQKYRYFLKLNVGGAPMAQEHIDKVFKMWQDVKNDQKN